MSEPQPRLSQLSTRWSLLQQAHQGTAESTTAAWQQLLEQYCRPIHRYLLGALGNEDEADELMQEFAFRLLRGDFHRADPEKGRFRNYVKQALVRLINRHRRRQRQQPGPLPEDVARSDAAESVEYVSDADFLRVWREELLTRAWAGLARLQEQTGQPFYLVLQLRVKQPRLRSPELAAELSRKLGRVITAVGSRQILHRARQKFAELLLAEVARTLEDPSEDRLTEELLALDLWTYCRPAVEYPGRD